MQLTISNTTYNALFNFNALDKLMEANDCEYFSNLGALLGEHEEEVSRSTITRYAELVQYAISEHNRQNGEAGTPDVEDIKPLLIENPNVLEEVANELSKTMPQEEEQENEQENASKKKNQQKKS